jgi:hypothetical protein
MTLNFCTRSLLCRLVSCLVPVPNTYTLYPDILTLRRHLSGMFTQVAYGACCQARQAQTTFKLQSQGPSRAATADTAEPMCVASTKQACDTLVGFDFPWQLTMWVDGKPCSESPAEACAADTTGACCYLPYNIMIGGPCWRKEDCANRCEAGVTWKSCVEASYSEDPGEEERFFNGSSVKFTAGAACTADLCSGA